MNKYSSYILYLLISVLVVILYVNDLGPMSSLQQSLNDWLTGLTAPDGKRPNVVIVEIDQKAEETYGEWPWDHDLIADLLAAIGGAQPRALIADVDLSEDAAQDSAGHTGILAGQLSWIPNIVLPYDIALSTFRSGRTNNPEYLFDNSLAVDNRSGVLEENASLLVRKVFLPAEKLLATKPRLGFEYTMPDADRTMRHQALVMNYEGYYYPSLELAAAATYLKIPPDQVTVVENEMILIGTQRKVPISEGSQYYTRHYPPEAFVTYSAAEVLAEGFDFDRLKGKAVLVGSEEDSRSQLFETPADDATPTLTVKANVIENIINDQMIEVANGVSVLLMIALFAAGAVCAFVLPMVKMKLRFLILGGGLIIAAGVTYYLAAYSSLLIQSSYLFLELMLFAVAAPFMDTVARKARAVTAKHEDSEGSSARAKAKTDPTEVERAPVRELKENPAGGSISMATVTQSAETGEQTPETSSVTDNDKTVPFEDPQAISLEDDPAETSSETTAEDDAPPDLDPGQVVLEEDDDLIITQNSQELEGESDSAGIIAPDESPTDVTSAERTETEAAPSLSDSNKKVPTSLGRYQVSGLLGKGAMGNVYKGVDPAISRPVALKTIRLDFVSDPEEEAELKERLHREAQAAGKLSHPNIVTIYDVGSEGQLQYIAMEYLEGRTLEDMIKKKVQFNFRILAQIIMQICGALQYAHEREIIHRDIKPANIMILRDYQVKVMDFGIARVESHSMTKTGIAMGTPNYISPEQLRGQSIDKRADLFSLGVVIYELLVGKRPFRGENITSLIYSVLNHEPEKPSNVNPQVPLLFDHIISKALQKDPKSRYQKASELVADLTDFVEAFSAQD
jgi:serine/threonine-protein kinase